MVPRVQRVIGLRSGLGTYIGATYTYHTNTPPHPRESKTAGRDSEGGEEQARETSCRAAGNRGQPGDRGRVGKATSYEQVHGRSQLGPPEPVSAELSSFLAPSAIVREPFCRWT